MAKVVTERPRYGHASRSEKTAKRLSKDEILLDDHGPSRAPARMHEKEFSDLLNPLRKFLRKRVGRHWNKVHSELCASLDKRSLTGIHIWSHVSDEVTQNVKIIGGKLVTLRFGTIIPVSGLYVCPKSGMLRWKKHLSRRERNA